MVSLFECFGGGGEERLAGLLPFFAGSWTRIYTRSVVDGTLEGSSCCCALIGQFEFKYNAQLVVVYAVGTCMHVPTLHVVC